MYVPSVLLIFLHRRPHSQSNEATSKLEAWICRVHQYIAIILRTGVSLLMSVSVTGVSLLKSVSVTDVSLLVSVSVTDVSLLVSVSVTGTCHCLCQDLSQKCSCRPAHFLNTLTQRLFSAVYFLPVSHCAMLCGC